MENNVISIFRVSEVTIVLNLPIWKSHLFICLSVSLSVCLSVRPCERTYVFHCQYSAEGGG
jgi:hypothetical protein